MKRLIVSRRYWAIATLLSVLLLVLFSFTSPLFPATNTQTELFTEIWDTVNQNFYDPNLNGVNWKAMRTKYEPLATQTKSSQAFAEVVNQMLGELNTSHTHYYTSEDPAYYQILGIFVPRSQALQKAVKTFLPEGTIAYSGIGIVTKETQGRTFVSAIFDGSPAAQSDLQVGDQILSVDEQPFHPMQSFAEKVGQPVKLRIQRTPSPDSQRDVSVTPKKLDATTMFLDAQKASTQVIQRNGKRLGYVHIWSYAGDQYQQQLEADLIDGRLSNADGLILDLRDGWGGAPLTALNIYSNQRDLSVTSISRNGKRYTSYGQWNRPVVMLVNEGSRSAKEILAFGFQQYQIGPVVGSRTAGYVVAGRPFLMKDNSLLYVAVADVYVNGDHRLEGKGVVPDIVVPFSVEYAQGIDPQKEQAIATLLEQLK
ncbi:PDZ domain-containing protein [Leptothermofonsia sichuanensis E412]|uniref:S41 family peptidase n=1 Tax=Leptothermofonsia sichuanensis TaxID=2917832 RepID=UPI001CA75661|nr:S41 family peptidase [Leptothermofonsia sichuanensis]QZZ18914.1 PDZ domain-containing protein [Leptothermofonsia sichuanensis E412]